MWVRGRPLAGIVGSNSAGGPWMSVSCDVVGCADRDLGSWPVPGPEGSYRVCVCVCVCVTECDQVQQ